MISGVERDTISLPQFNLESVIQFSTEDGYSPNEIAAMRDFVIAGGTLIGMSQLHLGEECRIHLPKNGGNEVPRPVLLVIAFH